MADLTHHEKISIINGMILDYLMDHADLISHELDKCSLFEIADIIKDMAEAEHNLAEAKPMTVHAPIPPAKP